MSEYHGEDHAVACTTPIFLLHDPERPEQVGSGVILRLSDRVFVASAAHVLDQFKVWDKPHVALGTDLVPFYGRVAKTTSRPFGRPGDP